MQKRNRLQIIHDILKTIQDKDGRIKRTHILYKSNLSYQMLDDYLNWLIKEGFVIEKSGKIVAYSLTIKGHTYLTKYKFVKDFMDTFGLDDQTG